MSFKKLAFNLGIISLFITGCTLNDAGVRGEPCPPGVVRADHGEKYISLPSMDCYADYVVIRDGQDHSVQSCKSCSQPDEADGAWVCDGDLGACLGGGSLHLRQDYLHCRHYREHGVFEGGGTAMGIAFYQELDGDGYKSIPASDRGMRTCPADYPVCVYADDYLDSEIGAEVRGAYGCTMECSGGLLYCGEEESRRCVNPMMDDTYCGARGSCTGTDYASSNWIGENCATKGQQCVDGQCVCTVDAVRCGSSEVCVDSDPEHCGGCDVSCADELNVSSMNGYVAHACVNSRCEITKCAPQYTISKDKRTCIGNVEVGDGNENNDPEDGSDPGEGNGPDDGSDPVDIHDPVDGRCDPSENACLSMDGVEEAECDAEQGKCIILRCKPRYHLYEEICEADDESHCGGHDQSCVGEGVAKGACMLDESGVAQCVTIQCEDGYHLADNPEAGAFPVHICEKNDDSGCVEQGLICPQNTVCTLGKDGKYLCACEGSMVRMCGEDCVNVKTDSRNCGECGNLCPNNQICSGGQCGCFGLANCDGNCIDINSNKSNCGACGNVCPGDQTCHSGGCGCAEGLTDCNGTCVNIGSDVNNCGACGKACSGGQVCNAGVCGCASGATDCSGKCINKGSDNNNCGACGNVCPAGKMCSAGACVCASGTDCNGKCINIKGSDKNNCGSCGKVCANNQTCSSGQCGCTSGLSNCSGTCINTNGSDVNNCGGCGTKCNVKDATNSCNNGKCSFTCNKGYIAKNGGCVPECSGSQTKCDKGQYYTCNNGSWSLKSPSDTLTHEAWVYDDNRNSLGIMINKGAKVNRIGERQITSEDRARYQYCGITGVTILWGAGNVPDSGWLHDGAF